MGDPTSSDVHTDGNKADGGFRCSNCHKPMGNWRKGSKCPACRGVKEEDTMVKAAPGGAAKPAAGVKPQAGADAKKPGGSVQDEFPKCPRCGTPSPDGTVCDDCRKNVDREHESGDLTVAQMKAQAAQAEADAEEEEDRRTVRSRARARMASLLGLDKDVAKATMVAAIASQPPTVLKSSEEARFSYAPMYMPGRMDAHGEFVKSANDLQKATWEYVRKTGSDRSVFLQHIDKKAGEWVEITSWPYAVEAPMVMPESGLIRKASLPAGTVYMGVIWEPWAWNMVKKGKLLGFSMGGWAKRVEAELIDDSVIKNASNQSGGSWTEERKDFNMEAALEALGLPPFN